jgi:hypothetical protein
VRTELYCPQGRRSGRVQRETSLNGIDYLEVLPSQHALLVHCFRSVHGLDASNVAIEGGVRVRSVRADWAHAADALPGGLLHGSDPPLVPNDPTVLVVGTSSSGDFSTYTLRLIESPALPDEPPAGFDELLSSVDFSFKVDCPSDFDCAAPVLPEELHLATPQIDYLAKDYASFRRLMLDRLAMVMPDWQERNPADVLVALVELLAYAGDSLSYFQDAAATEAYLGTARRRTSVRRHARLVDYFMHDGANARTWAAFTVEAAGDGAVLPAGTPVLTGEPGEPATLAPAGIPAAVSKGAVVFETMQPLGLREARNEIPLYTWGDRDCCLPMGSTRATLEGKNAQLGLRRGDVLVLEEVRGPESRLEVDADPSRRQAVRLVAVGGERVDPLTTTTVLDVEWHAEDALAFPLSLRETDVPGGGVLRTSVARGNVVLADHGERVPRAKLHEQPVEGHRYRPFLERTGLTHAVPYDDQRARGESAGAVLRTDPAAAVPAIAVDAGGERWEPERELLASDRFAASFVVEMEEDGRAQLRFGDGVLGRQPDPGETFYAAYRVGNGRAGNVSAEALRRIATTQPGITDVRNPLAAEGGVDPEPIEEVRLYAPQAFRTQRRAVTPADYAMFAERHPQVQKAGATRRWTGSWYTMFVTVDRVGGGPIDPAFEAELRAWLDPFRLAGYDLEIDAPRFVPLELAITVCAEPGYVRSSVKEALLETFSNRELRSGRRGFFHPDNFTFGQPVYLSRVVAAAMSLPGVQWVDVTAFHPWREAQGAELSEGVIQLGRLQIARLDNDPNQPENGRLELDVKGGV